jgi:hypothetical protein
VSSTGVAGFKRVPTASKNTALGFFIMFIAHQISI